MQEIGGNSLTQLKNIIIIFLSAKFVIDGHLPLGEMLATQYIVGQLNGPIDQLMSFIQSGQEAELSMNRLNEVHEMKNEEREGSAVNHQPAMEGVIKIENVSFSYPGANSSEVLSDLSLNIEEGKITAIVGSSGSGKTTLIKLLLMIYKPSSGIFPSEPCLSTRYSTRNGGTSVELYYRTVTSSQIPLVTISLLMKRK